MSVFVGDHEIPSKAPRAQKKSKPIPVPAFDNPPRLFPLPGQRELAFHDVDVAAASAKGQKIRKGRIGPSDKNQASSELNELGDINAKLAELRKRKAEAVKADRARRVASAKPPGPAAYRKPPVRPFGVRHNESSRPREYLTPREQDQVIEAAASTGRLRQRDEMIVRLAINHGLRAAEVCGLVFAHVLWDSRELFVRRVKRSKPSTHQLTLREFKYLKKAHAMQGDGFVFRTQDGGQVSVNSLDKMISRAGRIAKLPFRVHMHMLRHSCGHNLANQGQDTRRIQAWLGHQNIQHTVGYTEHTSERFKTFKLLE